ncbi:UNVERIFIED_CONTAM: hypothetical protein FKN15_074965 [Acipenser sinensis]
MREWGGAATTAGQEVVVPSPFGPPDWTAQQEQWRNAGAPMCSTCDEFGQVREDCHYGDPQYEKAWNQGLVGDAAEWFWAVDQTRPSPAPKREKPLPPSQPEGEEQELPLHHHHQEERSKSCLCLHLQMRWSAFLDALDVRKVLVGSEDQQREKNDHREKQGERGTFGQNPKY